MLEITKWFIDQLKADSTLSGMLGANAQDNRIYSWDFPTTITYSASLKAAIFYKENQNPRPFMHSYPSQRGNIYYYFSIVSPNKTLANQIVEYLVSKFENRGIFNTTSWRIGNIIMNGSAEGVNEGTPTNPLYKRNLSFLLAEIFRRN